MDPLVTSTPIQAIEKYRIFPSVVSSFLLCTFFFRVFGPVMGLGSYILPSNVALGMWLDTFAGFLVLWGIGAICLLVIFAAGKIVSRPAQASVLFGDFIVVAIIFGTIQHFMRKLGFFVGVEGVTGQIIPPLMFFGILTAVSFLFTKICRKYWVWTLLVSVLIFVFGMVSLNREINAAVEMRTAIDLKEATNCSLLEVILRAEETVTISTTTANGSVDTFYYDQYTTKRSGQPVYTNREYYNYYKTSGNEAVQRMKTSRCDIEGANFLSEEEKQLVKQVIQRGYVTP